MPSSNFHTLHDSLVATADDSLLPQGRFLSASLSRVLCLEYLVKFFQCPAFGFDKEQVDDDKFEQVPEDEENVEPVANLSSCQLQLESVLKAYSHSSERSVPQKY